MVNRLPLYFSPPGVKNYLLCVVARYGVAWRGCQPSVQSPSLIVLVWHVCL